MICRVILPFPRALSQLLHENSRARHISIDITGLGEDKFGSSVCYTVLHCTVDRQAISRWMPAKDDQESVRSCIHIVYGALVCMELAWGCQEAARAVSACLKGGLLIEFLSYAYDTAACCASLSTVKRKNCQVSGQCFQNWACGHGLCFPWCEIKLKI